MEQIEAGKRKTSKDRPRGKDGTKRQNSKQEEIQTSVDPEAKILCQEAARKYKRKKNSVPHKYNEPYKDKKGVMNSSTSTSETTSPITDNIDHLSLSSSSNLPTKNFKSSPKLSRTFSLSKTLPRRIHKCQKVK